LITKYTRRRNGLGVSARIYQTVTQSIPSTVYTTINLDTLSFGNFGIWNSGVANRLTVPVGYDGIWLIEGQVAFAANATGQRRVRLLKNGATSIGEQRMPPITIAASATMVTLASVLKLVAGDYLQIEGYQDTGAGLNTNVSVEANTRLTATYIGTA
jgi:hypothetical protein